MRHATLPETYALLDEHDAVDGSREITKALFDIANALSGNKPERERTPLPQEAPEFIPELQTILDQLSAKT